MPGVVIIGAGQAGGQAAASLRKEKYQGPITILGEEAQPPYERPPLSKDYLKGELDLDHVLLRPETFYSENDILLRTDTTVASIDIAHKNVKTDSSDVFEYEKLLIATGSRPRRLKLPGSDLAGIYYLRTLKDVDRIRESMSSASRLCVVGGGYVGLEVAAVAVTAGLDVTVIETEDRILQRVTTPQMSSFYHKLHSQRGVDIVLNTTVTGFQGGDSVSTVLCGDQKFDADIVIIGIGIVPNVEIAQAAGLECKNGILVDDHCRTSNVDIFAAGDCTNHPNQILGRRLRLESVPNAIDQAKVASSNMLGGDKVYAAIPWFWSDQYELKLQMVGFSGDGDEAVLRGDQSTNQFAIFYLNKGRVVAVDAVNSPREFMICKRLYGKPVDAASLGDETVELKSLLTA